MKWPNKGMAAYLTVSYWLDLLSPVADLAVRFWIAQIFWRAGMVKIQSMYSTINMFTYVYHVPLLPPTWAAYVGTGIELTFPLLLLFGLAGRFSAGFLFIYNIISIIAYPDMGIEGMLQQAGWGIMMLVTITHGPGKLSLDYLLSLWLRRKCGRLVELNQATPA